MKTNKITIIENCDPEKPNFSQHTLDEFICILDTFPDFNGEYSINNDQFEIILYEMENICADILLSHIINFLNLNEVSFKMVSKYE